MTVVEAYVGWRKIDPTDSNSQLSSMVTSLLVEGIAQNTNGSVYLPPVGFLISILIWYNLLRRAFGPVFSLL